jgi:hypothetical protein
MSDARGTRRAAPAQRPRFRCLGCQVFVIGTESGHCPRCGWVPPTTIDTRVAPIETRREWLTNSAIVVAIIVLGSIVAYAASW